MKYVLSVMWVLIGVVACTALSESELSESDGGERVFSASQVATASEASLAKQDDSKVAVVFASEAVAGSQSASDVAMQKSVKQNIDNDVTVLPIKPSQINSSDKNDKTHTQIPLNITLRNPPKPEINKKNKSLKASKAKAKVVGLPKTVVKLPPPKPALTRRQVLAQEIARERVALQATKKQLAAAKKSGNAKNIAKLNAAIKDRELNIRAIESEIKR